MHISYFDGYGSETSSRSAEIEKYLESEPEHAMAVAGLEMLRNSMVEPGEGVGEQPKDLDYWEKQEWQMCGPFDLVNSLEGKRYSWPDVSIRSSTWERVTNSRRALEVSVARGNGLFAKYDIEQPTLYPYGGFELNVSSKEVKDKRGKSYLLGELGLPCGLVNADPELYPEDVAADGWVGSYVNECGPGENFNSLLVEIDPRDREVFKSMRCAAWNACPGATNYGLLILPGVKANEEILTKYNYTGEDSKGLRYVNEKRPSGKRQRVQSELMLASKKQKRERIKASIARARAQKARPITDEYGACSSNDF